LSGYTVVEARDGLDALETAKKYNGAIDLLLTDVVMPGMGGRALAEELTRRRPELRTIFMSGYAGQAPGAQGPLYPGSDFLAKPFTREVLARKIRGVLDRPVVTESK
jgi:two-component system, cell cycle sensor histidine kinase and response regulator CckA